MRCHRPLRSSLGTGCCMRNTKQPRKRGIALVTSKPPSARATSCGRRRNSDDEGGSQAIHVVDLARGHHWLGPTAVMQWRHNRAAASLAVAVLLSVSAAFFGAAGDWLLLVVVGAVAVFFAVQAVVLWRKKG